jgi:hypothetical protein
MAGSPASACKLQAEFSGAFSRDKGQARVLIGWQPVNALLKGETVMGAAPDGAAFERDKSVALMILSPFATNAAQRPEIVVSINDHVARISTKKNLFAAGAAVLNHPYWIGVFDADCQFDLRLSEEP